MENVSSTASTVEGNKVGELERRAISRVRSRLARRRATAAWPVIGYWRSGGWERGARGLDGGRIGLGSRHDMASLYGLLAVGGTLGIAVSPCGTLGCVDCLDGCCEVGS